MSDVQATTQDTGAAMDTDSHFQGLWDSGAFDPNGVPPKEPGGQDNPDAAQNGAQDEATPRTPEGNDETLEEPGEAKEGAEEPKTYASLNDLLAAHKIDPESVMGLHVTTKIDGVETQVPLADVLKSYQLEGHVNNKSIEISAQKAQFEQERQAARTLFQQQIQQNNARGNLAMQ